MPKRYRMRSLDGEIKALSKTFRATDKLLRNTKKGLKPGSTAYRNLIIAIYNNEAGRIRALVSAGILPQAFNITTGEVRYAFRAYTGASFPSPAFSQKQKHNKRLASEMNEDQREQDKAAKSLQRVYNFCRGEMLVSLGKC